MKKMRTVYPYSEAAHLCDIVTFTQRSVQI